MYGYKIGQIISDSRHSIWADIKLPSIYKAMQSLEQKKYITGKEITEGNNPPRTVYSITPKGKQYFKQLLYQAMQIPNDYQMFWLALSFANHIFTRSEALVQIDAFTLRVQEFGKNLASNECKRHELDCEIPFVHEHLKKMGAKFQRAQLSTLKELKEAILSGEYESFFIDRGGNS